MRTQDCPCCESTNTSAIDVEFTGEDVRVYMMCASCSSEWTGVYHWDKDEDIDDCSGLTSDTDDIIADDNRQRAADLNATLRDIGSTRL